MGDKGKFDPSKHVIYLKNKAYLETKFRILWYREDHPNGAIQTELLSYEPMVIKATVYDGNGAVLATGHAGAVDKGNAVWSGKSLEKAESAAIGRALGHAGYGTQFVGAEDAGLRRDANGNWRDEQRERVNNQQRPNPPAKPTPPVVAAAQDEGATTTKRNAPQLDLTNKEDAGKFFAHWRKKQLTDAEILSALGVTKISEYAKPFDEADKAVRQFHETKQFKALA